MAKPVGAVRLSAWPISIQAAKQYIARWHRHHEPCKSALWAVACGVTGELEPRGVAVFGRPKARMIQNGVTGEIVRVATDGTPNACSFLYGLIRRIAGIMGYTRVPTYTLKTESGSSLRGAAAIEAADVKGREHDTPSRRRTRKGGAQLADKKRWELFSPSAPEQR